MPAKRSLGSPKRPAKRLARPVYSICEELLVPDDRPRESALPLREPTPEALTIVPRHQVLGAVGESPGVLRVFPGYYVRRATLGAVCGWESDGTAEVVAVSSR